MAVNLHEITNRALRQWIKVTGVDPDEEFVWSNYGIRKLNKYLRSAQDVDPTGLTAFMVTRAVAHDYVKGHSFNAMDIITADDATKARIEALGQLLKLVEAPEAVALVAEFQDQLKEAAEHYGVLQKVASLITDPNELSHIRRDALVCPGMLEHHTFAQGKRAEGDLKYNERVLKFWNMNSLVRAAAIQPTDGISIVLVRDPNVIEYSFFCFLVKDGENISVWTDAEKGTHPMQKHMSRSRARGRRLEERMSKLRFPYQLLKAKFDDEGHAYEVTGDSLVRTNLEAVAVARIEDLDPDQILWAIMVLDVLRKEGHQKKLSGTGEGMAYRLPPGTKAELPPGYLEVQELTMPEVSAETLDAQLKIEGSRAFRSTGVNNWIEERYADQVDPRLYNLTESLIPKALKTAEKDTSGNDCESVSQEMVLIGGQRINATKILPDARGFRHSMASVGCDSVTSPNLIGVDPVSFGTREEMDQDRLWIARWNQSVALGMAAVAEFDRRKDEVVKWFDQKTRANSERLIKSMVEGRLDVETTISRGEGFKRKEGGFDRLIKWHRRGKGDVPGSWDTRFNAGRAANVSLFQAALRPDDHSYPTKKYPLRCFVTGDAASIWVKFKPSTPEGIAALAGVEMSELPELLEYWNPKPPYHGNSILDRTDPLDSLIGNPWVALEFEVVIGLSKREWNRRVKACDNPGVIRFQIEKRSQGLTFWGYEDENDK